jgi:hypothetical protein
LIHVVKKPQHVGECSAAPMVRAHKGVECDLRALSLVLVQVGKDLLTGVLELRH